MEKIEMENPWYCLIPGNECSTCPYAGFAFDCQNQPFIPADPGASDAPHPEQGKGLCVPEEPDGERAGTDEGAWVK